MRNGIDAGDQYPIFQPVELNDNLANAQLGMAKEAGDLSSEASQILVLKQSSDYQQTVNQAKMSLLTDPSAANIAKQQQIVNGAKNGLLAVPLALKDRMTLESNLNQHLDTFNSFSAGIQLRQARASMAVEIAQMAPTINQQYGQFLMQGDHKDAENLRENYMNLLQKGIMMKAISPTFYENAFNSLSETSDRTFALRGALTDQMQNPDPNFPNNFHSQLAGGMEGAVSPTVRNNVQGYGSQVKISYLDHDYSSNQVQSNLIQNGTIDYNGFLKLPKNEADAYVLKLQGHQTAIGDINSDSYPVIQAKMQSLSTKDGFLGDDQRAQLQTYKNFTSNLQTDYFNTIVNQTPEGRQAAIKLMSEIGVVNNDSSLSDQQRAQKIQQLTQPFTQQIINIGLAKGIPTKWIKPFSAQTVSDAQDSFKINSDPNKFINMMSALHDQGQGSYLSQSLSTPRQNAVSNIIDMTMRTPAAPLQNSFLLANQTGQDYSKILERDPSTKRIYPEYIANQINQGDIKSALDFIGKQEGPDQVIATKKALLNYVYFQMSTNNDFSGKNLDSYINKAAILMKNSYNIKNVGNMTFNSNQLDITNSDAKAIQNYVINNQLKSQLAKQSNLTSAEISIRDKPFFIINTPQNEIAVINANTNQVIFREPYTTHLLTAAHQWHKKQEKYIENTALNPRSLGF